MTAKENASERNRAVIGLSPNNQRWNRLALAVARYGTTTTDPATQKPVLATAKELLERYEKDNQKYMKSG